ncbi:hypothetical protein NDU88_008036 [Pleurodeles waltl]|uniref:Uncharacterized protein n=1 Tax=Pleurodeles waltl TaxID=8319 RepID=A0AAV7QTE3_PLEWA|nr:hypothetical protein NDU88_008036 [Pleurodeles waltl]
MAQALITGVEVIAAKEKGPEWPKDGGDQLYSLTEDSDSTNSDQGSSESRNSISSKSSSFLSLTESPVRQQRRKSKGRAPSGVGVEPSAQTRKALKWDYSGTYLMSTAEVHTFEVQDNAEKKADALVCSLVSNTGARYTDSEMLQSIYDSIRELQTETRAESRRARMATKYLQGTVRKVVKSCAEIEGKLSSMEERTMAVEADIEALRAQTQPVLQKWQWRGGDTELNYILYVLFIHTAEAKAYWVECMGRTKNVEGVWEGEEEKPVTAQCLKRLGGFLFCSAYI